MYIKDYDACKPPLRTYRVPINCNINCTITALSFHQAEKVARQVIKLYVRGKIICTGAAVEVISDTLIKYTLHFVIRGRMKVQSTNSANAAIVANKIVCKIFNV